MRGMNSPLSASRIAAHLRRSAQQVDIQAVASTGSTNADLLAQTGHLLRPVLLVASSQSAGRGRAGRAWQSAPGASLTFSLAWNFSRPLHQLIGLPLAVGVGLAEVLAAFNLPLQLKWPNDLLRNGKKVGGVLIESAPLRNAESGGTWIVIGIGLNLQPPTLDPDCGPASARPELIKVERELLLAELTSGLADTLLQFEQDGFAVFCARWNRLHAYAGQQVALLDHGRVLQQGTAQGVDASGCLLLQTAAGLLPILAGDVSLRLQEA
jgi:BirA family transcriptional regulator, biotin operon repressor / biotin---[acetyl-CoA-carboxylase] ligase